MLKGYYETLRRGHTAATCSYVLWLVSRELFPQQTDLASLLVSAGGQFLCSFTLSVSREAIHKALGQELGMKLEYFGCQTRGRQAGRQAEEGIEEGLGGQRRG